MTEKFVINPALTVGPQLHKAEAVAEDHCFALSWQGNSVACNLPFLKILLSFREPSDVGDVLKKLSANQDLSLSEQEIASNIKACIEENMLINADGVIDDLIWHANGWGDALAFHYASRDQQFHDQTPSTAWDSKERVVQNYMTAGSPPAAHFDLSHLPLVQLPAPEKIPSNFYDTLLSRRTSRNFLPKPIKLQDLSSIFHASTTPMKTTRDEAEKLSKEHLSMHLHSWLTFAEICIYAHNCEGIEQGLYHYDVREHALRLVKLGDFSSAINQASWKQGVEGASLILFIMADLNRYMWKYRNPRHYKAVWVQSAALAHRFILTAQALNYGSFQSPAMHDATVISLFDTSIDKLMPIYLVGLGPSGKT